MQLSSSGTSEVAILSRILEPEKPTMSAGTAREILELDFKDNDKARMRVLAHKAQEGTLTPPEKSAIDNYERVGHLLNIMQSKARRSLTSRRGSSGKNGAH